MDKVIIAYNKGYRVTNNGEVISKKGIIKGGLNQDGYVKISVKINKQVYPVLVHRLQAYQKYGENLFKKGIEARHLNGIKTDNTWENVLIGTHSENMMDIPEHIRISKAIHASKYIRKYEKSEVIKYFNNCKSYKKTMEFFKISSKGTLWYILNK